MDIIDAHIHIFPGDSVEDRADDLAKRAGHENNEAHLREEYARLGVVGAVVMGNHSLSLDNHMYPDNMRYCVGLDSRAQWGEDKETYDQLELHLQREKCVGVKLYPGYNYHYAYDKVYGPVYELTGRYGKPVAVHTGELAFPQAQLKYCHPLTLDEAASNYPGVQFVMCHLGNPWFVDAAAVICKNENISADLSGMLVGLLDMPRFFREQEGYIGHIKTWLAYMDAYDRMMFGTDWPLANIQNYIDFVAHLIPDRHHEKVFAGNARRVYALDF